MVSMKNKCASGGSRRISCPVMPKNKCADRGRECFWPDVDEAVNEWVLNQRKSGFIVTRNMIRIAALRMAKEKAINNFKGTVGWCRRLMEGNHLSLRCKTKIAQKLPDAYEKKITNFLRYLICIRVKNNYELGQIGNMDETPMWFDMPNARTVNRCGEKTVLVKTTGHEKSRFTVVLTCMADGTKLKPMVVFKRKTMPNGNFPAGVVIHVHPKGWMDDDGTKLWFEKVWNTRPGALMRKNSLFIWDSFSCHITDKIKKLMRQHKTDLGVIPDGLTSQLQPLDVYLNKSFIDHTRADWNKWMVDGEKSFTKGGNMRAPDLTVVASWVKHAWEQIPESMVKRSFKCCGIYPTP